MHEVSLAASQPLAQPTPQLRPLPPAESVDDGFAAPGLGRTVTMGGPLPPRISTLTISARLRGRSVVEDTDLTPDEIGELLDTATRLKRLHKKGEPHAYLPGKTLAMLFQHPSTRTRVSFEAGMAQLGGHAIFLGVNDLQMKRGETLADTGKVLSRYVDAIMARVASHSDLVELATAATVPVFNGLTDKSHPLQALSDLLTLQERFGSLSGLKLTYLGDGNNVLHSLLLAGAAMGVSVAVAAPAGFEPSEDVITQATWLAAASGAKITVTDDPWVAAKDADAIYADVHVSMGQVNGPARAVALAPYKVTQEVMSVAKPTAVFLHCLPMHRDEEVAAAVADGPQSIVFDQAENRLHLQKALLLHALC